MTKKALPLFIAAVFGITLLMPFNARAEHEVELLGCNLKEDLDVIQKSSEAGSVLSLETDTNERIRLIKNGARIVTDVRFMFGNVTFVEIDTDPPVFRQQSFSPGSVIAELIEPHVDRICKLTGEGTSIVSTEPADVTGSIIGPCTLIEKDDFDNNGKKDGLNIQSLGLKGAGGEKIVGLQAGGTVSNWWRDGSQRPYVNVTAFTVYFDPNGNLVSSPVILTAEVRKDGIAHNAASICEQNDVKSGSIPLSLPSGGSLPDGTSGSDSGTPASSPGFSGAGADTAVGSGDIKEDCFVGKKIELPDGTSFENEIVGPGDTDEWAVVCLINTFNIVTDWIFVALMIVAVALIAIGGFMWMVARDSAEKQKQAGQIIFAAVIGLIIAILARVIPGIVTGILL